MKYTVKQPHYGDRMYRPGDKREVGNQNTAKTLINKGLLFPNYRTKEDKRAYNATNKAYVKHKGNGWYDIYRSGEVIEESIRGKSNAQAKRDEYNA